MAQTQSRKRKSTTVLDEEGHDQQSAGGPVQKRIKITQAQKQALIDNLQLESKSPHYRQSWSMLTPGAV
jgi:hypothetical protein